jgi:hypothetical protein
LRNNYPWPGVQTGEKTSESGTSLVFANFSTLYSYDSDTSGAEFNRWTVTSTGLTLNDNTGYTLNGIGGFSGFFKIPDGLVYAVGGGVVDPTTTPTTQLGQFSVNSAKGMGQSIAGTGGAFSFNGKFSLFCAKRGSGLVRIDQFS